MRECRSAQKDSLKKYKELYKDSNTQMKFIKDKLIVGTKVEEDAFQTNPLVTTPCSLPKPQLALKHTELKKINGNTFQGHAVQVHSISESTSAKDCLFQIPAVAQSDHLIYVYSTTNPSGMKIVRNNDGVEWAVTRLLANLIKEHGLTNTFLAVARKHAGPNLGYKRFKIVTEIGIKALHKLH